MKLVVTVVGKDRVGIIAMVSQILAENNVNILNINQNIMDGFFNMVLIAETSESKINLVDLQKVLKEKGKEINVDIKAQHADIFNVTHNV
ncbi:ACT domain-containing protein [uncultured Mitsuokella sp.]|jgi:ACT domain-containing protein|uniref:ACT domain-containing protein n=1 Tax=uncultured Mitsuokella sp. TaxID=453120 RepID=UPI0025EBEB55|nr:ACT domain-containing protein [uncultured Mitsuokella sp.]